MPVIKVDKHQYALRPGPNRVAVGDDADVRVAGDPALDVLLAHAGRGSNNDIVIQDDSVSEAHAELQRRDDGWYVVAGGSPVQGFSMWVWIVVALAIAGAAALFALNR